MKPNEADDYRQMVSGTDFAASVATLLGHHDRSEIGVYKAHVFEDGTIAWCDTSASVNFAIRPGKSFWDLFPDCDEWVSVSEMLRNARGEGSSGRIVMQLRRANTQVGTYHAAFEARESESGDQSLYLIALYAHEDNATMHAPSEQTIARQNRRRAAFALESGGMRTRGMPWTSLVYVLLALSIVLGSILWAPVIKSRFDSAANMERIADLEQERRIAAEDIARRERELREERDAMDEATRRLEQVRRDRLARMRDEIKFASENSDPIRMFFRMKMVDLYAEFGDLTPEQAYELFMQAGEAAIEMAEAEANKETVDG